MSVESKRDEGEQRRNAAAFMLGALRITAIKKAEEDSCLSRSKERVSRLASG